MTQQVKNAVSDYIEYLDKIYDVKKLTQNEKKERMLIIKAVINLCNDFEKKNLWNKFKTIYPMINTEGVLLPKSKSIPVNFKK
jgi:hypothetical protein